MVIISITRHTHGKEMDMNATTEKKKKRKKWPIVLAVVLVLGALANFAGNVKPAQASEKTDNPLLAADFKTADILNGLNTEKIGEYGYIQISKSDMENITGDQLTEFCKTRYDNSGLNWVWIMFEDGTGIYVGPSWTVQMEYGVTDAENRAFSALGLITRIQGDGSAADQYTYVSYEDKDEIKADVEALVPDTCKGSSYSCDILTASDGSGYIVSLQIDVDTEDCAETIQTLESAVKGLGNPKISEVEIIAVEDFQIVGTN